jgi:hypothetical protein
MHSWLPSIRRRRGTRNKPKRRDSRLDKNSGGQSSTRNAPPHEYPFSQLPQSLFRNPEDPVMPTLSPLHHKVNLSRNCPVKCDSLEINLAFGCIRLDQSLVGSTPPPTTRSKHERGSDDAAAQADRAHLQGSRRVSNDC